MTKKNIKKSAANGQNKSIQSSTSPTEKLDSISRKDPEIATSALRAAALGTNANSALRAIALGQNTNSALMAAKNASSALTAATNASSALRAAALGTNTSSALRAAALGTNANSALKAIATNYKERTYHGGEKQQSKVKIQSASDLGLEVRRVRKKMKMTQQKFADLAGVGRRFISELESGKPTLEFNRVMKVCQAAGIDISASSRENKS